MGSAKQAGVIFNPSLDHHSIVGLGTPGRTIGTGHEYRQMVEKVAYVMGKNLFVYNLEFPSHCATINIHNYGFSRIEDYERQYKKLEHRVTGYYPEYSITAGNGTNAITAIVSCPEDEFTAVLEWADESSTALSDILLLLTLFTGQDVFSLKDELEPGMVITAESRLFTFGGCLRTSIPYKAKAVDDSDPYIKYDVGFEESLNTIYELMRKSDWQTTYGRGYFLILAKNAFKPQILETSFSLCWTIWEHLFTLLNRSFMSDIQIHKTSSSKKIAFILEKYALASNIDDTSRKSIGQLSKIRNRLVHFGRFTDSDSKAYAVMFIRLTEFVIAKILCLEPSNIFNTMEDLETFLKAKSK